MKRLLFALLFVGFTTGCATQFSADPINSQVVDADTGEPLEGAVVVAHWQLNGGSLSSMPCGSANVEEAVTDKDGKFHLAGWGPVRGDCASDMNSGEPILYIFKSGYGYGRFPNGSGGNTVRVTHSTFDNRQLELAKFKDMDLRKHGPGSYQLNFGLLNGDLANFIVDMPYECNWKKVPNMIVALAKQGKEFDVQGNPISTIEDKLTSNDSWFQKIAPKCGSPKQFIEGLTQ